MKKTFKQIRWPAAFLMILMGGLPIHAEQTGILMKFSGTIDSYDRKSSLLVVDDRSFRMELNTAIINKQGKSTTSFQLTPRTRIRLEYQPPASDRYTGISGTIKTIWLQ